jgi:anti-sigma regulatory factor (Ser/Thr protein kinase)
VRTGAAANHRGYFHETAFYDSDEEFLAVVVPFFADAVAAGEPAVAAFGARNQRLVRDALGAGSGVRFLDGDAQYLRPAVAIRQYREMLADYVAAGAGQIRVAGDVPHPGVGVGWDWWARYEATVNRAYDDFPIWGLCPYDTRSTPADVIDDVWRTHPHVARPDGHIPNPRFEDPVGFLAGRSAQWHDPLEAGPAVIVLADPAPSAVRTAISQVAASCEVPADDVNGLLVAATEAVSNATLHGRPRVAVRIWAASRRILVAVSDQGPGPSQPFAGLLPTSPDTGSLGGRGLWLIHQLCSYVTLQREAHRFTIRLVAGEPAL